MKTPLLVVIAFTALLAGCSSVSARKTIDLHRYKHIYVEQRLSDNHHLDEQIATELKIARL